MTLPFPPRRSHLTAFWLGLNLAAFVASSLLALSLGMRGGVAVLLLFFAAALAAGLTWSDVPLLVYRLWNRTAKAVARFAQWWVLAVTYYLVLAATGRGGSRLDLAPPSGSMWKPYGSGGDQNGSRAAELRAGWASRFARHALDPRRVWWIGVLPFLLILTVFRLESDDEDVPSNIYTLY